MSPAPTEAPPTPSRLGTVAPWLATVVLLAVGVSFVAQRQQGRNQDLRWQAAGEVMEHGRLIERQIDRLQLLAGLTPFVLQGPRPLQRLDEVAVAFRQDAGAKLALRFEIETADKAGPATAAPGAADFPGLLAGGRAIPFRSPTISTTADRIVASQVIHRLDERGVIHALGTAHADLALADLAETGLLESVRRNGHDFRLRLLPQAGGEARTLLASHADLRDPVAYAIRLANGDQLLLELSPAAGWSFDPFLLAELALAVAGALLAGLVLHILLRRHQTLQREAASARADAERQRRLLDAVLDHLPLLLVLRDGAERKVVRANAFAEPIFARERQSMAGQSYADIVPAPLAAELAALDAEVAAGKRAVGKKGLILAAAEGERTLDLQRIPLFDEAGRIEYLLDVIEDSTERRQLDRQLTRQLRFLEDILATVPVPIYVEDEDGRLVHANLAFERFFGLPRHELVGRPLTTAAGAPLVDGLPTGAPPQTDQIEVCEVGLASTDGQERSAQVRRAAILDETGQALGSVGVVTDLSGRIAAQRRVEQANRMLQVVSGTNEAIVRTRERAPLLERACEILVERGQHPLTWFHRLNTDAGDLPELIVRGAPVELARQAAQLLAGCDLDCARELHARETAIHVCLPDRCGHPALMALAVRSGMSALALLPIRTRDEFLGVLGIFTSGRNAFGDNERRLLGELADDLSYAMESISQEDKRRRAEESLRLSSQVFENSSEGIMITDAGNRILLVNKAFSQVTGYEADEVLGKNPRILSSGRQDAGFYREMWALIQRRGEWHGEVQNRRKNGEFYTEWLTISAVRNEHGEITNYVAVFTDITSAKQVEERLNFLANYDTLTGLPNRILFTDRLEQAIAAARANDRRVAVLFLDLDRFKLINETFGHSAGDTVLQEVTRRIKAALRPGDSASRMGGDEFAIILPDLDDSEDAAKVASEIMTALTQPIRLDNNEVYTSASIGVSVCPEDGQDVETLFKNADSAMYRAMEEGHNTFRFYHQEMNARSAERMSLETDLRRALERGELVMHYQPFVDSASGRIVGAEALLRWHRPGSGYITPAAFIPMLEETGLIVPVGEWILATACSDNLAWRQHGFGDLFVAVNFSAVQLNDPQVAAKLAGTLGKIGFDPRHLEIELTESVVMRDADRGIRTLNEFREIGTRLSIDDFGTGYSSLAYLKRLPIDTLKIDRSFITDTPVETEAKAIVQAIVAMGHSLDLKIIAEGVQDPAQVNFLRQIRCDLLQGFYFSSAVDQPGFLDLLKRSASRQLLP